MTDTVDVKAAPREALRRHYREEIDKVVETIEGGPWDGRRVVTVERLDEILAAQFPRLALFGTEVATPGRVVVTANCPQCDEHAEITVAVSSELRVEDDGATLRVKGKSKAASHICGQTSLDYDAKQGEAFELEDIVGSDDSDDEPPSRPRKGDK